MSLVLIWPSTVMRSKDRSTAFRRSRFRVLEDRVGLDEAEHRGETGLDHAGAFGLGGER